MDSFLVGAEMDFKTITDWFAGGNPKYMELSHCMNHDYFWITLTVTLDIAVACGYLLIAAHWWKNQKALEPNHPAASPLRNLRNIFLFCGLCGYVFIPIKMVWPAWRLYDMFMVVLVFSTWRFALQSRNLRVVYSELGRNKQLAIDLEESRAQSKRKTMFLNAVSHDLRTPLNGLVLQTAVAEMGLASNDHKVIKESIAQMKLTAKVAADMLNGFLELGRLDWNADGHTFTEIELKDLMAEAVRRAQPEADVKKIQVRCGDVPSVRIRSDKMKLSRVLDNLVGNAVKFTDTGSVTCTSEVQDGKVHLHVIDTGEGIAPDDMKYLFDEFYQVKNHERNPAKGFGLGLAIARRLVDQLGGQILVQSEPGRGSRFTVVLNHDN